MLNDLKSVGPSEILSGFLYVGDSVHGSSPQLLESIGIFYIVNITMDDYSNKFHPQKFHFHYCKVHDHPKNSISSHFDSVFSFIESARESKDSKVLIHCGEGVSRSCTLAVAYLMKKYDWSLKKSLLHVRKYRPQANPNNGFMRQLLEYEDNLFGNKSLDDSLFADDWGFGCYQVYSTEF